MSISITYGILFEVRILHHFFLNRGKDMYDSMSDAEKADMMLKYDAREIFEVVPTGDCSKILHAHNCIFRFTSQGIIIGLRAEADDQEPPKFKPFKSLDDDLKFTFLIKLRDMDFMNYTALPFTGNSGQVYSFVNTITGSPKKSPAISVIPPVYTAATEYFPGDMLSDNPNNQSKLFTALRKTSSVTSNAGEWLTEVLADNLPMQYVNVNDRHPLVRGLFSYQVKVAGIEPIATVKTASGLTVTPQITILPGDFRTLQIDMRHFPEGFYSMHVESAVPVYTDDIAFYLLHERVSPFGIIEINVKSDDPSYNIFDPQGFMLSPAYELRFRNRSTRWRYVGKKFNAASVTEKPLPLTRHGFIEDVKVIGKDGGLIDDLPNPTTSVIKTEALVKATEKNYYSEIHIN